MRGNLSEESEEPDKGGGSNGDSEDAHIQIVEVTSSIKVFRGLGSNKDLIRRYSIARDISEKIPENVSAKKNAPNANVNYEGGLLSKNLVNVSTST